MAENLDTNSVREATSGSLRVFDDVACTVCGCVCDDLRITVENEFIVKAENACELAEPWFLEQNRCRPPVAAIDGNETSYDSAIAEAANLLRAAKSPLIFGLSRSSTDGQRAAVRLADALGGTIDTTASLCHAPSIMAIQEVGESTCSLGEIRHRADLVMFWGVDPVKTHPRHLERYSAFPVGQFVPGGREGRHVVVVDHSPNETSELADEFVQLEGGKDFEVIWALRCLVQGIDPTPGSDLGIGLDVLQSLSERMKACQCGVLFFGLGLARSGIGHRQVEALLRLVTDLNAHTRFHARRMRLPGDVAGADSVLCWQTGFPFSVNLSRGYPRYNPGEYSANELLERNEVDACLMIGSEWIPQLSAPALEQLKQIPRIVLDYPTVASHTSPTVRFTTGVYGIHLPGTAYRMDEIPIPLRAVLEHTYPSDGDVLRAIQARLAD